MTTERCPKCDTRCAERDEFTEISYHGTPIFAQQWRYECPCGWTWTDAVQRANNTTSLREARRAQKSRLW